MASPGERSPAQPPRDDGTAATLGSPTASAALPPGAETVAHATLYADPVPDAPSIPSRCLDSTIPRAALWLGVAGLLPFAAGSALLLISSPVPWLGAADPLLAYGAVILSFLGAVHWGLAMAGPGSGEGRAPAGRFVLAISPSLVAWCALLIPSAAGLALLTLAFVVMFVVDREAVASGAAPRWYGRLRAPLSVVVVTLLATSSAFVALEPG